MAETLFSIIIPHKNIPSLLQRCLDSIPQRDDVQIIIVDDNSNPKNVDFEKFPGLDKPNTEVYFDKSNKGAGRARNIGLRHVRGEWVIFADCDDYFHIEILNEIMDTIIPDECLAIYWGTEELYPDGSNHLFLTDSDTRLRKIPSMNMVLSAFAPWKKMVRMKVLCDNNVYFDEIPASNDVMFQMRLVGALNEENIYWFPKRVYTWVKRENSITTKVSIDKAKSRFVTSLRANKYAQQHGWGKVDNSLYYMQSIKKLSKWHFFCSFYQDWWYLGLKQAIKDYRFVCSMDSEHILLHANPFMLIKTIMSKVFSRS